MTNVLFSVLGRMFNLSAHLEDARKKAKQEEIDGSGKSIALLMKEQGEEIHTFRYVFEHDGTTVSGKFRNELPELHKGELIVVPVDYSGFFSAYLTDLINRGFTDGNGAVRQGFESLLGAVGRRAPFEDLFADEKQHHHSLKRNAEFRNMPPLDLEDATIANFAGDLSVTISQAKNEGELLLGIKAVVGKYAQLLPYKARNVFFSDVESMPNFGKEIQDKFGIESRKSVSDYVRSNTNDPIFSMVRLLTVDNLGTICDRVMSEDRHVVKFDAAEYLAASGHYHTRFKKQKVADKLQTALEGRINSAKVKRGDLSMGLMHYFEKILADPTYRVAVDRSGDHFSLESLDDSKNVVANILAVEGQYEKMFRKIVNKYRRAGNTNISLCDSFRFGV